MSVKLLLTCKNTAVKSTLVHVHVYYVACGLKAHKSCKNVYNERVRTCALLKIFYFLRRQERRSAVHKFAEGLFISVIPPSRRNIIGYIFGLYDSSNLVLNYGQLIFLKYINEIGDMCDRKYGPPAAASFLLRQYGREKSAWSPQSVKKTAKFDINATSFLVSLCMFAYYST